MASTLTNQIANFDLTGQPSWAVAREGFETRGVDMILGKKSKKGRGKERERRNEPEEENTLG